MIVRPPAVYGPGDRETLELFRMAKLGLMLMPPKGRVSVIHADDLARLLLALAAPDAPSNILIEPDDGKPAAGPTASSPARSAGRRNQACDRLLARHPACDSRRAPTSFSGARKPS